MTKDRNPEEMTEEEIAREDGEPLPDRHALSVIRGVQPLPQPFVIEPAPGVATTEPLPDEPTPDV
jgi:hypothetical protein